jgi:hypothetical protein
MTTNERVRAINETHTQYLAVYFLCFFGPSVRPSAIFDYTRSNTVTKT